MRVQTLPFGDRGALTPVSIYNSICLINCRVCAMEVVDHIFSHTHTHTHTQQGFENVPEDSVVPHTPILNEGKQLGNRMQTLPSVT